jgi:4-hydroxy-tetrahydrodipicolinate synthase
MLNEHQLRGIYVPVVSPFLPNEQLDLDSYRTYVEKLASYNIQGLVVNGTTGESPTVAWNEVEQIVKATKEAMKRLQKRLPLIIGTGTNDTASSVRRTLQAEKMGAEAVLVVTPYYSKPSQAGILEHYRRVAETGVPVIAYEVPSRTGVQVSAETMRRILELNGVIGLKDSTGGTGLLSELSRYHTKPVLCGEDIRFLDMLNHGASGGILASANVQTNDFIRVFQYAGSGMSHEANTVFERLVPLIRALFRESNPAPLKWLLARQGIISSATLRPPMGPVTEELQKELDRYRKER